MSRVRAKRPLYSARPFEGNGTSLYLSIDGEPVQYRQLQVASSARLNPSPARKTTRVAFAADPATSIDYELPPELAGQSVTFDLRRYADDVESLMDNSSTRTVVIDEELAETPEIMASAYLVAVQILAGGRAEILFVYTPSPNGLQPERLELQRVSGPSSPAALVLLPDLLLLPTQYTFQTDPLLDSATYEFRLVAIYESVEQVLISGIVVQVDASGPPEPTITVEVY